MALVEKKKLSESIIEEIKNMVLSGSIKEGDKLPNQNEFSKNLGVSRISLREALNTLTILGAIEQRPGYGTYVRSVTPILHEGDLKRPAVLDSKTIIDLTEARIFIEPGAAELAAKNATKEEIDEMGALMKNMHHMRNAVKEKKNSNASMVAYDFHFLVVKASHNRFILSSYMSIQNLLSQYFGEAYKVLLGAGKYSYNEHLKVYKAIEKRNQKAAFIEMKKHLLGAKNVLEWYYKANSKGKLHPNPMNVYDILEIHKGNLKE